ncbi:MAG: tyrosine--tRNA ligase [Planctomycetaceae bacterium]|jgi:tyrosyl-tRNA synthetase|nr:tyrosine--tRNA ligase [Planctomycetaceae bacterium]
MNDIISELHWRGLIHQLTNEDTIADWLSEKSRTVYAGFDPTADSLHVGHLVALMNLRRFQQFGHRPIALAGGATGTIGDPSGKSDERKLITKEQVGYNIKCIEKQLRKFLRFDHSPTGAVIVNNADWFSQFSYIDFLRDVGKHFSVNVMLAKESVKLRLENKDSGLSFTEFSYMLMQSYDFVHLYKTYNCEMQIGGSDQWGNITMGCDFARRLGVLQQGQLQGLTSPLLTKNDGTKMGKTEGGALWLDPNKTPPYLFYQYWINLDDADVEKTLKIFTDLPQEAIAETVSQHQADPGQRIGQRKVADELTQLVHGESGLSAAKKATDILFGGEISELDDAALGAIFADVPSKELGRSLLSAGLPLTEALAAAGLVPSKSEARRMIQQGGAYINNRQIADVNAVLTMEHLAGESLMVVRSGKKKYALLRFV